MTLCIPVLNVVMLSVTIFKHYAERHYAKCLYTECRGAIVTTFCNLVSLDCF